jgi:hypothetical protein
MASRKTAIRNLESAPDSEGDRRAGSVGERPELAGSRDKEGRSAGSKRSEADLHASAPDPILDGDN